MFTCCYSKKILTSIIPPEVNTKVNDPPPGPVPNLPFPKVQPPTPNLTQDQILKIQGNLVIVKTFVKDLWLQQGLIINEVWSQLQSQANISKTSNSNSVSSTFGNFLEALTFVTEVAALIPGPQQIAFSAVAILLSSSSSTLTTNGSDISSITGGDDISQYVASQAEINNSHYYALIQLLDYFHDHPNDCRDYILTIPASDKSTTIRVFIDNTFPTGTYYDNWVRLAARIFRRKIVLTEMAKPENHFLDIYFIYDQNVGLGRVYQPGSAPFPPNQDGGTERLKKLDHANAGKDAVVWSNREIIAHHPEYTLVDQHGTSDTDYKTSYTEATGKFIGQFPSAYTFPWAMTYDRVYAQKYYIMEGFGKVPFGDYNYTLCDGRFLHWLFIDDGAGNITNADGVAFRYEVLRTGLMGFSKDIFDNGHQISDTILDRDEKWLDSSMNYIYGPQSSKDTNQKFHVYTGDLLLKNLPQ